MLRPLLLFVFASLVFFGASAFAKDQPAAVATEYVVRAGDSLNKIAKKTAVSVAAIKDANGLTSDKLRVGQKLRIPGAGESEATARPAEEPAAQDDAVSAPKSAPGKPQMIWPVASEFTTSKKVDDGIEIEIPLGQPIHSSADGVVIYAGDGLREFGNTVLVRHEDGLVTVYGFASSLSVKRGQKVKRGDTIALSGQAPSQSVPSVHFEVRRNAAPVDPFDYVKSPEPGNLIKEVQSGLKAFGNDMIEISGFLGTNTRAAIKEFQALFGLPVTGEPDDKLLAKMKEVGLLSK